MKHITHTTPDRRDECDMETRYLLLATEEIERDFERFTPEQARDLRAVRDAVDAMLLRVSN